MILEDESPPQVKGVQYATGKVVVVQSQSLVQLFATP